MITEFMMLVFIVAFSKSVINTILLMAEIIPTISDNVFL